MHGYINILFSQYQFWFCFQVFPIPVLFIGVYILLRFLYKLLCLLLPDTVLNKSTSLFYPFLLKVLFAATLLWNFPSLQAYLASWRVEHQCRTVTGAARRGLSHPCLLKLISFSVALVIVHGLQFTAYPYPSFSFRVMPANFLTLTNCMDLQFFYTVPLLLTLTVLQHLGLFGLENRWVRSE